MRPSSADATEGKQRQAKKTSCLFVSAAGRFRVWRGCKPEGLKRRLGGGSGEAYGSIVKATVQIARHARLQRLTTSD